MSMLLFVTHRLWSIFGDSGSVVSSVVSSDPALLSFHMLTGNLDRAHGAVTVVIVDEPVSATRGYTTKWRGE